MEWLAQHVLEILLGLVSLGLSAFCKYLYSQMKYFKELSKDKDIQQIQKLINASMEPILDDLHELSEKIDKIQEKENQDVGFIVNSYRFRLIQLCQKYLQQGYITPRQYEQLSEFYKVYSSLGGNGQAKEYVERAFDLPIHE